jgi:hypothetical protein
VDDVTHNPALPSDVQAAIETQATASGLEIVTADQAEQFALDAGLPADQAAAVADSYASSLLIGLQNALAAVAIFALLGLWFTRHLPLRIGPAPAAEGSGSPAPAGAA